MSVSHTEKRLMLLAERLIDATSSRRVDWTVSDPTGTSFTTSHSSGSVTIESDDRDGAFPFTLIVIDPQGRRIESLTTGWTRDEEGRPQNYEWNELWRRLYNAARSRALNIDSVIDSIIRDVTDDDPRSS
jgi:hypothetical protein